MKLLCRQEFSLSLPIVILQRVREINYAIALRVLDVLSNRRG